MVFGIDDALLAPIIGSAVAPIIGGIIGNASASDDRDAAKKAQADALKQILDLQVPDPEQQKIYLERLVSQGKLDPDTEAYISATPSKMENINVDPRLKDAQMKALTQMQALGTTGLNAEDKLMLNKLSADTARQARGRDEGILQNMAMRGMGGGGQELVARMMSSESAAQNQGEESDRIAAMAQRRALESIANAGGMAGNMRNQDFDQQSAVARAQDEINRFNTSNRISAQQRNIDRANSAKEFNLREAQRISDANVGLSNQQEIANKGLVQQKYNNELNRAGMASGAFNTAAQNYNSSAQGTANMWAGIGSGVGKGFAGIAEASLPRGRRKTDTPQTSSPVAFGDSDEWLDYADPRKQK